MTSITLRRTRSPGTPRPVASCASSLIPGNDALNPSEEPPIARASASFANCARTHASAVGQTPVPPELSAQVTLVAVLGSSQEKSPRTAWRMRPMMLARSPVTSR